MFQKMVILKVISKLSIGHIFRIKIYLYLAKLYIYSETNI